MKDIQPTSRQKLGADNWVFMVARNLANPFVVGDLVVVGSTQYRVRAIEGTIDPKQVNLVVEKIG